MVYKVKCEIRVFCSQKGLDFMQSEVQVETERTKNKAGF